MFALPSIEKTLATLTGAGELPLAIELWDGRRYELGRNPRVTLRVPKVGALRHLARPDLASLGTAYVEGQIDVVGPIDEALRAAESLAQRFARSLKGRLPRLDLHSRRTDSAAIRYHYDVSNEFYRLWLDERMVYSCAYFRTDADTLDQAQAQKLDHICRKLRLAPGDRLLDIGCGWGALVIWAAQHYGVRATGVTLSQNQHALANERIHAAGLADRCEVRLQDYRDIPGEGAYDKIASVGMFEHVGLKNLPVYFRAMRRLLADGGIALNHGITALDTEHRSVGLGAGDFIHEYVFPHGELPHLSLVLKEMAEAGLEVTDVETLRLHYARTLAEWSRRFEARLAEARAAASDKHVRIWRLYLAGCAHAFARNWVTIHQVQAVKHADPARSPLPWTRDYLYT